MFHHRHEKFQHFLRGLQVIPYRQSVALIIQSLGFEGWHCLFSFWQDLQDQQRAQALPWPRTHRHLLRACHLLLKSRAEFRERSQLCFLILMSSLRIQNLLLSTLLLAYRQVQLMDPRLWFQLCSSSARLRSSPTHLLCSTFWAEEFSSGSFSSASLGLCILEAEAAC